MTAAQMPNWKVIVNDGPTKIVPASNIMVAMHRGLERIGLIDTEIEKLEVRRVRDCDVSETDRTPSAAWSRRGR